MPNPQLSRSALIDAEHDNLVRVRVLAKLRLGKDIAPSTIWRWVRKGARGCKLEAVQILGSWYSTSDAFAAFISAQTVAALGNDADPAIPAPRSPERVTALRAAGLLK